MKYFIGLIFFLVSITAKAGVCNNGSLTGGYSFTAAGVGTSQVAIGKVQFNGAGVATFVGTEAYSGFQPYSVYGTVTYSVDAGCFGSMTINWDGGGTTVISLVLNEMDNVPATRVAYGAAVLYFYGGEIATGSLKRVIGKFN